MHESDEVGSAVETGGSPLPPTEVLPPIEVQSDRLPEVWLELTYLPDFLLDDLRFWFVPNRENAREVYHELVGRSAANWGSYYSKKGIKFLNSPPDEVEGPVAVEAGGIHVEIVAPGRFRQPTPQLRFTPEGAPVPIPSLEKKRPLNPWRPNFLRSLEFIRKYDIPHPIPRRAEVAIWEIEECGEIAGSVSWMNAERMLLDSDSEELRATLADLFFNRPEDFPLGSQVFLRVLGNLGSDGFTRLLELARHPIARKRCVVAKTLGDPGLDPEDAHRAGRIEALLLLLEDEDPYVRDAALRSLGRVRLRPGDDPDGLVRAQLEAPEASHRIWAAEALLDVDEAQRTALVEIVKTDPRPLADLGELGEVVVESEIHDAVPFLIARLRDGDRQVALDAAEVLEALTGAKSGLTAENAGDDRRLAVKTYERWWDEFKLGRKKRKG